MRAAVWMVFASALALGGIACGGDDAEADAAVDVNTGDSSSDEDASSDEDGGNGSSFDFGSSASFDELIDRIARQRCGAMLLCSNGSPDVHRYRAALDEDLCVSDLRRATERSYAGVRQGLESGSIVFDREAAERCWPLESLCTRLDMEPLANQCLDVLKGSGEEGDTCTTSFECGDGLRCGGDSCPGQCEPHGSRCGSSRDCEPSEAALAFCELDCQSPPTARPDALEGEPCDTGLFRTHCSPDFYCSEESVCAARKPENAACERSAECMSGFWCTGDVGACTPIGTGLAGAPCLGRWDCDWAHGYWCREPEGRCELLERGGVGDPCEDGADGRASCQTGLYCLRGSCVMSGREGESCVDQSDCAGGGCEAGLCTAQCLHLRGDGAWITTIFTDR